MQNVAWHCASGIKRGVLDKDILWMAEYVALKPVCTFHNEWCLPICACFATYFPLYCCVTCKIFLRGINTETPHLVFSVAMVTNTFP